MKTSRTIVLLGVALLSVLRMEAAVPAVPQNLQPSWIYEGPATYARLTWDASDGAASYNVYRLNTDNSGWYPLRIGLNNLIHLDYDAISAPKSYVVTAVNGDGESAASEIATATDGEVMVFLHRSPSEFPEWDQRYGWVLPTSANITWLLPQTSGADGMLEFGPSTTNMATVYFQPGYQLFGHGVTLTNLAPATPYYYRITSVSTNRVGVAEVFSLTTPDTNHPPAAGDVTFGPVTETWEQPIAIPGSDLELNTSSLTARIITQPTNGTVSAPFYTGYDGYFLVHYQPSAGARGEDFFQYVVNDGEFDSSPGTVAITNIWLNRTPQPASFETNSLEDVPLSLTLAVYEPDGDAVAFEAIGCLYGTVTGTAPNVVYTPATNFSGQDTLFYLVTDGYAGGIAQGFINITVSPVNDAPRVSHQNIESPEDSSLPVSLSAIDVEGDPISYSIVDGPTHGILSGTLPVLTYTPGQDFVGTDHFSYVANDGAATSAVATVTIIVTPVNDLPVADNASGTVTEDDWSAELRLTGADVDGDALTFEVITPPTHGTIRRLFQFYVSDWWVYRPDPNYNGPDSFTFTVNDGTLTSAPATFSVTVAPANDAPVATGQSFTTQEDTSIALTADATDIDGDALIYSITMPPAHGTVTGTGPVFVYSPAPDFNGTDAFEFTVTDAGGISRAATNTIIVQPVADAPIAYPQSITTPYNTPLTIFLAASDPDGDLQYVAAVSTPANGTLIGSGHWLTFIPNPGFSGTTSFDFRASDYSSALSAPATVTISVQPAMSIPAAPSGLTATVVSSSRIDLSWVDHAGFDEDGFKVERSQNGNSWTQIATLGPSTTSFSATGLSGNRTYYFRVRAFNVVGNSAYSNTASARTPR